MRVDGVFVDPVGLIAGEAFRRELPDADDVVLQLTVDAIAIDVEYLGEAKEILELLLLGEGSGQDMRVQQPHLGNRGDIHGHVARLFGTDARIATVLDPIATDPIRLAGRFDVALDIWAFDIGGVGTHRELLHQQRPQSTDQDRRQHQRAAAIAGILKSRKKIAVKNDTAHNTAIATSTSLAGSSAWISV
ncbi:Uncharacterised protein [Mycobacterium tuberculosis]|nr:Uncharacterised protein [Mycobacterium tuberculosis]CKS21109.1 Uncharacterised protein [Mycobacterium tuberculosis]